MQVRVDRTACTGHGRCYDVAPDICEADGEGSCVIKVPDPGPALAAQARLAERSCPERAIHIVD